MKNAEREAQVWADRVAAFYRDRVALDTAEMAELAREVATALVSAAQSRISTRRWPDVINATLDTWEASRSARGPRVAYLDHERGHVTTKD